MIKLEEVSSDIVSEATKWSADPTSALVAAITPERVIVDMGGGNNRTIGIEDFIRILSKYYLATKKEEAFTLLLPPGCFYFSKTESYIHMSIYVPEMANTLKYEDGNGKREFDILFPNTIISFTILKDTVNKKNWKVGDVYYFATPLAVGALPTEFITRARGDVHMYPFTNIYSSSTLCYGSNQMPLTVEGNNFRGLQYFYKILSISPFNSDLGIHGKVSHTGNHLSWYKELAELQKEGKPFPYDKLTRY